jgi:hypothetical protein
MVIPKVSKATKIKLMSYIKDTNLGCGGEVSL